MQRFMGTTLTQRSTASIASTNRSFGCSGIADVEEDVLLEFNVMGGKRGFYMDSYADGSFHRFYDPNRGAASSSWSNYRRGENVSSLATHSNPALADCYSNHRPCN
jgi:hypothetical protein